MCPTFGVQFKSKYWFSDDLCVYQTLVRRIFANKVSDTQILMNKRRLKLIFRRRLSFTPITDSFRFFQQSEAFHFVPWACALPDFRPALRRVGVFRLLHQTVAAGSVVDMGFQVAVLRPSDAGAAVFGGDTDTFEVV